MSTRCKQVARRSRSLVIGPLSLALAGVTATVGAQPPALPVPTAAEVEAMCSALRGGTSADGGRAAHRLARDLEQRAGADPAALTAAARLYCALALSAGKLDAALPARTELLDATLRTGLPGGAAWECAVAFVLRSEWAGGDITARRALMQRARAADLGRYRFQIDVAEGIVALLAEEYGRACDHFTAALEVHRAQWAGDERAWLYSDLFGARARAYLRLGLLDLAAADAQRFAALEHDSPQATYLQFLCALAGESFDRAIALGEKLRDVASPHFTKSDILRGLGSATARQPRMGGRAGARAVELFSAAIDCAGDASARASAQVELASQRVEQGDFTAARALLDAAGAVLGSPGHVADARRELWARFVAVQALLRLRGDAGRAELERSRIELSAVCASLVARWDRLPLRPGGIGLMQMADNRAPFAVLVAVQVALAPDQPALALQELLAGQARGTLARSRQIAAGDLASIQAAAVPPDGGILVYLPLVASVGGSHLFAVDRQRVVHVPLALDDSLRPRVFELRRLLAERAPTALIRATAAALREVLLPPAAQAIVATWHHVGIVGRDLLADLAFEALPGADGAWFGTEKALYYLPSLPVAADLARRHDSARGRFGCGVLAATGHATPVAPALAIGAAELEALTQSWAEVRCWRDAEATTSVLQGTALRRLAVLHVIGHGVEAAAAEGDERQAAVALRDAVLRCADVEAALAPDHAAPPVALLSVCGSASGPLRRGDDCGSHFAGSFLMAGSLVVVGAASDLRVDANLALTRCVHDHLAAGVDVAEALRRARQATAGRASSHPSDFVSIGVWGSGHLALAPNVARRWRASALLWALVAGGLVAVMWRWRVGTPRRLRQPR